MKRAILFASMVLGAFAFVAPAHSQVVASCPQVNSGNEVLVQASDGNCLGPFGQVGGNINGSGGGAPRVLRVFIGGNEIRIDHTNEVTNVTATGFAGTDPGSLNTTGAVNSTVQFDVGGNTYTFQIVKNAGATTIQAFDVSQVVAPAAGGTGDDSKNLGNQQSSLSNLVMNLQANALGDGLFGHLDGVFGGGSNGGPVVTASTFSASTTGVAEWLDENRKRNLETQLADLPSQEGGQAVTVMPVAALMPRTKPKWNAWIKGNYRFYDGDGSSFDGDTIDVLAGIDYRVSDSVVIGLAGGYGVTDFDTLTGGTSGAFEADGYTAGAYMGIRLGDNAQFDTLAAYTYSDYENRVGAVTGEFSAHRVTVGARLKGTFESAGGFFIEPGVRVLYAEERQDAYTDSAGVRQSSLTIRAGRVSAGPKVGYVHRSDEGSTVKTWLAAYGEYDFSNQGNAPTSGLPDFDDIISGRVSVGFSASSASGIGISLEGDVGSLGSGEYISYGGTARIALPL